MKIRNKLEKRNIRRKRIRAKIRGTSERPRLSVFRSNRWLWVQLIDDNQGRTVAAASSRELAGKKAERKGGKGKKEESKRTGERVGELVAKRALEKNIQQAVFDRGGYKYHGLVKAAAEGARKAGLKF